ncbi:MAG: WecB/TagA/CpsF family glycosyltransferase [Candidatus Omnitrophica bacterium]|nr:WecB/TagA/CpsF family glycosyltransferase [Candidatus Omnitrophota bacterium]
MDRIEILGVQIDNVTWDESLERVRSMIRSGTPHQIVTPATEQIILARKDAGFRRVLEDADLVVADGMPLVFASRWHRTPLKARITGVDLVPAICKIAAEENAPVFFLGGEEGTAAEAARVLQERIPGLKIAGSYCPPFGFEKNPEEDEKAIQAVQNASPQVLFVALGCPKQEKWIHRNQERLGASAMIGIGGAFNMIIGKEKRAPQWLQDWGLEGVYRFCQRPKVIWKRIIVNAPYFVLQLIDLFTYKTQKRVARWIRPLCLGVIDALIAPLTFLFSYWLYFRSGVFSNEADPFADHPSLLNMPAYSDLMIVVSILAVSSFWFYRLYDRNKHESYRGLSIRILKSSLTMVLLLIGLQFLFFKHLFQEYHFQGFSRVVFGFFGVFSFAALLGWRCLFMGWERLIHRYGVNPDRIILVGRRETADRVAESLNEHPEWGNLPLGVVCESIEDSELEGEIPVLGGIDDLPRLLPARKVDEILIVDPDLPMSNLLEVVRLSRDFRVRLSIIPSIHELLGVQSEIKQMGEYRVITVALDRTIDPILKR